MTTAIAELREMGDDELVNRLIEARQEQFNFRFQHVTGQLDNYARLGEVRKEIARINTLLREREIAAAEAGELEESEPEPDESPAASEARRARVLGSRRAARAARAAGAQEENDPEGGRAGDES